MSGQNANFIDQTFPVGMEVSLSVTITEPGVAHDLVALLNDHAPHYHKGLLHGLKLNQIGFFDTQAHHGAAHRALLALIDSHLSPGHAPTRTGEEVLWDVRQGLLGLMHASYTRVVDTRVTTEGAESACTITSSHEETGLV